MLKEKYISEAQMKEEPKKKLVLKIKEGSITPEHFNKRLVDEYLISVVDSVEDTGMLPEDKAKLDALPTAEELQQALDEKQNDLTFDSTPTVNSNNPVKSKGIKAELDKKQDKLTNGWVVQIKDEEAGSSGILHKPKLINEDGNEVDVIVGATDRYSGWEQGGDTRIPTIGLVKEKLAAIDVSDQIGGKANKSEMSVVAGTGANADKTTITLKNGTSATVLTQHQDVSEFLKEGEVFGTGDDTTASFNPYSDTVWNKAQTLSEIQKQQIRENIGVSVTDNEDIQSVNGTLKFADRAYTATTSSVQGNMGYKILRKGSTFASQVTAANTIYEIRYDYDLNAQTFTMPAGCVLKFNGGSVSNGTITLDETGISADNVQVFYNISLYGNYTNDGFHVCWIGCLPDDNTINCTPIIKKVLGLSKKRFLFNEGRYYFSEWCITTEHLNIIGIKRSGLSFGTYFYPFNNSQYYIIKLGGEETELSISGSKKAGNITIRNINFGTDAGFTYKNLTISESTIANNTDNPYICGALVLDKVEIGRFSICGSGIHNMPVLLLGYCYECQFEDIIMYSNHGKSDLPIITCINDPNHAISATTIKRIWVECFVGPILWMHPTATIAEINVDEIMIEGSIAWERESIFSERSTVNEPFPDYYSSGVNVIPMFKMAYYRGAINSIYINGTDTEWSNTLDAEEPTPNTRGLFDFSKHNYGGLCIMNIFNTGRASNMLLYGNRQSNLSTILQLTNTVNINIWNKSNVPIVNYVKVATKGPVKLESERQYNNSDLLELNYGCYPLYNVDVDKTGLYVAGNKVIVTSMGLIVPTKYLILGIGYTANKMFDVEYWSDGSIITTEEVQVEPNSKAIIRINDIRTFDYIILRGRVNIAYFVYSILATDSIPVEMRSGSTSNRPLLTPYFDNGFDYFDTTLNKSVYFSYSELLTFEERVTKPNPLFFNNILTEGSVCRAYSAFTLYYMSKIVLCKDNDLSNVDNPDNIVLINGAGNPSKVFIAPDETIYKYIYAETNIPSGNFTACIATINGVWREQDNAIAGVLRVGNFSNKPTSEEIYPGFRYFCTDKQTTEGATDGIEIIHKGNDVWVDALGRVVS